MRPEFLILFLLVGLGTYLTRFVPLLVALRREKSTEEGERERSAGWMAGGIRYVGPSIIVALLATSVLPQPGEGFWPDLLKTAAALVPTVFAAVRLNNLGLTVFVGVLFYWLVSVVV